MKVLSIGSDKNLFREKSAVRQRMIEYGSIAEELHIIVFCKKGEFSETRISDNVYLYPTNSSSKLFYFWDAAAIGKKRIKDPDQWLIMTQDPFEAGLAGYLIKRKINVRLQIQVHGDFASPYFAGESFLNRIRVSLATFLLPKADGIRVVSGRIGQSLKNYSLKKEPVIFPIYVDIKKTQETEIKTDLHQKYPQFDFIILMASRLAKVKNIDLAIEAMSEIVKAYPKTGLIIVGRGEEENKLKSKTKNLALSKNINFEPWNEDLASYYKTADLFLLSSNHEGYGLTIPEAMAAGCPVIMTDVGCAGELVKDGFNGLVLPVNDKEALIEDIKRLISEPGLREKLKVNGLETVKKLPTKEEYFDLYKNSWKI
jgi:glycosyltransferase involved in cell wall biosynthesis